MISNAKIKNGITILEAILKDYKKESEVSRDKKEIMNPERTKDIIALQRTIAVLKKQIKNPDIKELPVEDKSNSTYILLSEWAREHGMLPASARQKAGRGLFETAHKQGHIWMIDKNEINQDRRKKHSIGEKDEQRHN